jgi:outer membrane protein TolC
VTKRIRLAFLGVAIVLESAAIAEPSRLQAALPDPLTAPDVITIARKQRKEILAARERARAAWEGSRAEGKLPDPMLMTNLDHLPIPIMGADFSAMWQQEVPLSGELGARVRRAEAVARMRDAEVKTAELEVELSALRAFFMLVEEQAMRAVVAEQLELAQSIEKVVEARLAAGAANPSDAVRAGLDRVRLETELETFDSRTRAADAMLDAALGRRPDSTIRRTELRLREGAPEGAGPVARTAIASRPEVTVMRRKIHAAEEDVEVMRNMRAPMGVFGLGGAYTMAEGPGLMATVGVSLPIWVDKYDSRIDEAKAMVAMERADLAGMLLMVEGEAVAAREQVEAAQIRERSIRTRLLPQATTTFETVLASYASGQVPVVSVLEALAMLRMLQMEHVQSRTALALRWAELGRQVGRSELGFTRSRALGGGP